MVLVSWQGYLSLNLNNIRMNIHLFNLFISPLTYIKTHTRPPNAHNLPPTYQALNDLEITKAKEMAEIESKKFTELVGAIGKETIVSMARAGPETQAKLLKGLGLKGFLVSDGKNPINLFNTANGKRNFIVE